jgi:hypothetical protein
VYAGRTKLSPTRHSTQNAEASAAKNGPVLLGQQNIIEAAWDKRGDLLLRQSRDDGDDHELRIRRDCLPRFLHGLDALRQLIADRIREDETP